MRISIRIIVYSILRSSGLNKYRGGCIDSQYMSVKRDYYLIQALDQLILQDERDNEQVILNLEKAIPDDFTREKFVLSIAPLIVGGDKFVYTAYPERMILDKYAKGKALTREQEIDVMIKVVDEQTKKAGLTTKNAEEVIAYMINPKEKTTTKASGRSK